MAGTTTNTQICTSSAPNSSPPSATRTAAVMKPRPRVRYSSAPSPSTRALQARLTGRETNTASIVPKACMSCGATRSMTNALIAITSSVMNTSLPMTQALYRASQAAGHALATGAPGSSSGWSPRRAGRGMAWRSMCGGGWLTVYEGRTDSSI
jgi:hypothetical protein